MTYENPPSPLLILADTGLTKLREIAGHFGVDENQIALYGLNIACHYAEKSEYYRNKGGNTNFHILTPPEKEAPSATFKRNLINAKRKLRKQFPVRDDSWVPSNIENLRILDATVDRYREAPADEPTYGMFYLRQTERAYVERVAAHYSNLTGRTFEPRDVASLGIAATNTLFQDRIKTIEPGKRRLAYGFHAPGEDRGYFYYPLPDEMLRKGGYHFPLDKVDIINTTER